MKKCIGVSLCALSAACGPAASNDGGVTDARQVDVVEDSALRDSSIPDRGMDTVILDANADVQTRDASRTDVALVPDGAVMVYQGWPFDSAEAARRQQETAAALGLPPEVNIDLGGGVALTMVVIPAGEATLGCTDIGIPSDCEGDETLRSYMLPRPLLIGRTVFTRAHFNALAPIYTDDHTPMDGDPQLPALQPYRRVQDVIRPALQTRAPAGWVFRLPTVDEWEYAARAGVTTFFTTGNATQDLAATAWYADNSNNMLHDVALKIPNAWDVHDMIGNAWTWVWRSTGYYSDGDNDPMDGHIVMSCPYTGQPLDNECRISNYMISLDPEEYRFVADIPVP